MLPLLSGIHCFSYVLHLTNSFCFNYLYMWNEYWWSSCES